MITIIFTDTNLVANAHANGDIQPLVNAELGGRAPLRNTTHVFLKTIIERYKAIVPRVVYPIGLNLIFGTRYYYRQSDRKDLLGYIMDRREVFSLIGQHALMDATMKGWQSVYGDTTPWMALDGYKSINLGVKTDTHADLQIKSIIDKADIDTATTSALSQADKAMLDDLVRNFNTFEDGEEGFENEGVPDSDEDEMKIIPSKAWNEISNKIFLHINNLYLKLPECKSVFLIGSYFERYGLGLQLEAQLQKLKLQTVLIPSLDQTSWASLAMHSSNALVSTNEQTQESKLADTISKDSDLQSLESTPQSQTLNQTKDAAASGLNTIVTRDDAVSSEFIVDQRIKDQSYMLFFGFKRHHTQRKLVRFIPYSAYEQVENKVAFIKVYKKERQLFPKIGTVVNGQSGKYYMMPDIKAKSLKEVIAQSRISKGSAKDFKSEDIQLVLDIYKTLDQLPITFTRLSADNIYIRRREWWRRNSINEVYFLGVTPEDSTKESMTKKLDEVLQSLIHPSIIEHIDHFKNDI